MLTLDQVGRYEWCVVVTGPRVVVRTLGARVAWGRAGVWRVCVTARGVGAGAAVATATTGGRSGAPTLYTCEVA